MRRSVLITLLFILCCINNGIAGNEKYYALSCTPTITTNALSTNTLCAGSSITVTFSFTDCVFPGNIFSVELSDSVGSFSAPINIGNVASTTAIPIDAVIPGNTLYGTKYRIRVVSNNPVAFGADNGVNITILPKPTASFSVNNSLQCLNNNNFTFTNSSSGAIANYIWNFGNGASSTQFSPNYTYATAGNYNVTLKAIGTNGCIDSMAQVITVHPKPTVNFSIIKDSLCLGSIFEMTNNSTISTGTMNHLWLFDDGTTAVTFNVNKSFNTTGSHLIKLISTSDKGCKDSLSKTVFVFNKPTANFTINLSTQCFKNNIFNFQNTSTGYSISNWSFGDATTSILTNPSKAYSNTGTFNVQLKVLNNNGCIDSTSKSVTILSSPIAAFSHSASGVCNSNLTVNFSNNSTGTDYTNFWQFGDGTSSTALNPTKLYSNTGTYLVKLVVTNINGCKDSTEQSITISPKPIVNFTVNSFSQCAVSHVFAFTNQTSGAISYFWNFDDGITSILTNPNKTFVSAGTYQVKLIATNSNGCKDSITKPITVFEKPNAAFTITSNNICNNNLTIQPNNSSTGVNNSYTWHFGDGTTSNQINPTKTYSSAGTYTIKLVAQNTNGCIDSTQKTITISTAPTANFTVNSNNPCSINNVFNFNNTSIGATSYFWNFDDGITSLLTSPSKAFTNAGTYNVKLIATNANGCKDSIVKPVTIFEKPTAAFTLPSNNLCTSSLTVSPINNSTGNNNTYLWYFGDGSTSTIVNPTKTYATIGTYTIKLVVTTINGCKDSIEQNVTFSNKPIANFSINNSIQCGTNNLFAFSNLSTGASSYVWHFGDGITSTASNPSKSYNNNGTYIVKLVAKNTNGCSDSISKSVTIDIGPKAHFTYPGYPGVNSCLDNLTIPFTNASTNANSYSWSFGDTTTSTLTNPTKNYSVYGTYTVKLIAINNNGCKDSSSQVLTLAAKPIASFTITDTSVCLKNNNFDITNTSTGGNFYLWSFGDGTFSSDKHPSKTYAVSGVYTINLTVTNSIGCFANASRSVQVKNALIADFNILGYNNCALGVPLKFSNTSIGYDSSSLHLWSFGDGTSSISSNPFKTYTTAGTYIINYKLSNGDCVDSISRTISLQSKPTSLFSVNSNTQCINGNSFVFTNQSTGSIVNYVWDFGDGTNSNQQHPTKTYTSAGTFTVSLTTINSNGCSAQSSITITVKSTAAISFTINQPTQCLQGNFFTFTNTSPTQAGVTYYWSFGDGLNSTQSPINKSYAFVGTYQVSLITSINNGCVDSISKSITVAPLPKSSFTHNANSNPCSNTHIVNFNNNSTGNLVSYIWDFGDGTSSNAINPQKIYNAAGTYVVTLTVINATNCSSTSTKTIVLLPKITAAFSLSSLSQCLANNSFTFRSLANVDSFKVNYFWNLGDGTTSTSSSVIKSYSNPGTYTVSLTVINVSLGCVDVMTRSITVYPKPSASLTSSGNICQGNTFVINTSLTGTPPFQLTYTDGVNSYNISNINANIYGISVSPTANTTYQITSLIDANCVASPVDLSNSKSVVTVTPITITKQPDTLQLICVGNKITLEASINTTANYSLQWQKNSTNILGATSNILNINSATLTDNGIYRLAIIMPCGTVYTKEAKVVVEPQPAPPAFTPLVGYCRNETAKALEASGNYLRWYTVETGGIAQIIAPIPNTSVIGTQQFWVSNSNSSNSCESPRYLITVKVSEPPTLSVSVIGSLALLPTQSVQLIANTATTNTVKWYKNGVYVGPSPNNSIILTIQDTGIYVAEAMNTEGCKKLSQEYIVKKRADVAPSSISNNLILYPNPASTKVTAYFDNPLNQDAQVRLVNMWGQVLQIKTVKFTMPFQRIDFIIGNLKADIYAIEIINEKGFTTARNLFIKAN